MKKVIYTLTISKPKERNSCQFCYNFRDNAPHVLSTGSLETNKSIAINHLCDNCKTRWDNKEIGTCSKCERPTKVFGSQCMCEWMEETGQTFDSSDSDENEDYLQLEKQINDLSLEKEQLQEDIEIHLDAIDVAAKAFRGKSEQDLIDENNALKKQITELQLEMKTIQEKLLNNHCQNCQVVLQIEVPPKK